MAERGAIKLSFIVAAALGVGFSASVFLNYQQHERAEAERKLLHGEITDLRYQIQQDQVALNGGATPSPSPEASASPSPSPSATPSPSTTPAVAGASTTTQTLTLTEPANFRSAPRSNAGTVLPKLPKGTVVTVVNATPQNKYLQVSYSGKTGYILASVLE